MVTLCHSRLVAVAIDTADTISDLLILEGLKFWWTGLMLLALYQSACVI
jgi:hypothetical protein